MYNDYDDDESFTPGSSAGVRAFSSVETTETSLSHPLPPP